MADGIVQVPPDSTGKKIDAASMDVGANTVMRQRIVIGDNSATAQFALVTGGALTVTGTFNISAMPATTGVVGLTAGSSVIGDINAISRTVQVAIGTPFTVNNISAAVVLAAGTANIGAVSNAAGTALMGAVSLAAGTANIGFINNISATVVVSGLVGLTAGTSVIGDLNAISRTVQVAIGTPFTVNNISAAVVLAAGAANIGFINGISATISTVLAAGTANIGTINNISAAVTVTLPANIGTLNNISAAVVLAAGTANIGAVSNAAGTALMGAVSLAAGTANIGFINNISAPVVLAAGSNNIGTINNISAAVSVTLPANIGVVNNISASVLVAGEIANGASLSTTNKPVLMGGNDSAGGAGGVMRSLLVDSSGRIILAAGTNNIGAVSNAAGTALMGAVSLAAGTANIGFINNISATVVVSGLVGLTAGSSVIGDINAISRTVQVAVGTPFTINNISAATAIKGTVAFNSSITAGDAPLLIGGRVKTSASTTATAHAATYAWFDKLGRQVFVLNHPSLAPSASHGPKTVTVSTSASVVLIAAPGAGNVAYVDSLLVTNGSSTLTRADIYELSATATPVVAAYLAAAGGGFSCKFDPPWRVSANTALNIRIKPNVSQVLAVVHFHVGVD